MSRIRIIAVAAVALLALSACTPEQTAKVINDYAAMRTQSDSPARSWSVESDCSGIHVTIHGYTGGTQIAADLGLPYAQVFTGGVPGRLMLDATGSADAYIPLDANVPTLHFPWGVTLIGAGLDANGVSVCEQ